MSLFNKHFCCIILVSSLLFDIYSLQFGNGNDESSTEFIQVATDVKNFHLDDFNSLENKSEELIISKKKKLLGLWNYLLKFLDWI